MRFELVPIIDQMLALYEKPRDFARFKEYLGLLTGDTKDDLALPIGNFNPMAKEHVSAKLIELKNVNAESLIEKELPNISRQLPADRSDQIFKTVLTVADDLKGGWTNRYTTDYANCFRIHPMVKRNFCTPIFWVSEQYDEPLIIQRTREACARTHYAAQHPKPQTLADHVEQEIFVARYSDTTSKSTPEEFSAWKAFFESNKETIEYPVIFNFLYGDTAAKQLGYTPLGVNGELAGFRFAAQCAQK